MKYKLNFLRILYFYHCQFQSSLKLSFIINKSIIQKGRALIIESFDAEHCVRCGGEQCVFSRRQSATPSSLSSCTLRYFTNSPFPSHSRPCEGCAALRASEYSFFLIPTPSARARVYIYILFCAREAAK